MQNTVKERLIIFLKHKKISKTTFCNEIGVSRSYVSSMRKSMQPEKLTSISIHFPDLNTEWLLTGEGEMLKTQTSQNQSNTDIHYKNLLEAQGKTIAAQEKTIAALEKNIAALEKAMAAQDKTIAALENRTIQPGQRKKTIMPKAASSTISTAVAVDNI